MLTLLRSPTVGAGQTGLQVAARFKQMQISALVIDRDARIGDMWRKRYPSLVLHTPKGHHSCEYGLLLLFTRLTCWLLQSSINPSPKIGPTLSLLIS